MALLATLLALSPAVFAADVPAQIVIVSPSARQALVRVQSGGFISFARCRLPAEGVTNLSAPDVETASA